MDRKESAYERACSLLGKEEVLRLRKQWDSMDTKYGGKEFQQGEGMIISLLKLNLSQIVIRAIFPVGGSRAQRLKKVLEDGIETLHTRRQPSQPAHALTDAQLQSFLYDCEQNWVLEDGFPCSHRRPRRYFVSTKKTTWKSHWEAYKARREAACGRVISYTRWTQLVHFHYPDVRLTRTTEDD